MRKIFIGVLCILFLGLCACEQAAEPEEPEEIGIPRISSIEFLSERITTPSSYQAAPKAYNPVLDDYYLFQQLCYRYIDEWTEEASEERETLENEMEKRGFIDPNSVPRGEDAGYAVQDINNDGIPELLLLEKTRGFYREDKAYFIDSLYTIQDNKAVPILVSPFWLRANTILAADGTFYHAEPYQSAALYSYGLDADATELTVLSEYHATLRFSGKPDTVPVPYWYKVRDGEKEEITEKEFDALEAKYRNPGAQMELTFYPIDVDAPAPVSPKETTALARPPIQYPASYKCVPKAYKPILDDVYKFDQLVKREDFGNLDGDYVWGETHLNEIPGGELGYAVKDINRDGIPELLILSNSAQGNGIFSLFTIKDNKPINISYYWSRYFANLTEDGTIYTRGSGGAARTYLESYKLEPGATELTQLAEYQSDYFEGEDPGYPYFFKVVDGKNQYIAEKEFWALEEKYINPARPMKLNFIPINQ